MKNADLANVLTNALGSPHFDPDQVIALANLLPEITAEAKKRY